jgi:hypothetical protein
VPDGLASDQIYRAAQQIIEEELEIPVTNESNRTLELNQDICIVKTFYHGN